MAFTLTGERICGSNGRTNTQNSEPFYRKGYFRKGIISVCFLKKNKQIAAILCFPQPAATKVVCSDQYKGDGGCGILRSEIPYPV